MALSPEEAIRHARALAQRGETQQARQLYQALLAANPANQPARDELAALDRRSAQFQTLGALYQKGEFGAAIAQATGAREFHASLRKPADSPMIFRNTNLQLGDPYQDDYARYVDGNPNGSYRDIAGIRNEAGNVVGLMPHPEHAVEALTGTGTDGLGFFLGLVGVNA